MRHRLLVVALLLGCTLSVAAGKNHSYLFAWCGDDDKTASDFLAVIDAEPASPGYGQVVATVPTGVAGSVPHHTEVEMPVGGLLMANGFEAGRTWVFDLRDPLQPHIVAGRYLSLSAVEFHSPHNPFTLLHIDQLVGLDVFHRIHLSAGPVDLQQIHFFGFAQASLANNMISACGIQDRSQV